MNWLAQNWIWIALALGVFLLFARRGHHSFGGPRGALGGGHDHGSNPEQGAPGGVGQGGAAIDPVSGKPLSTEHAISTYFRGRVYFFENEENRRRFEAAPENFPLDRGIDALASSPQRGHRSHGC